MDVRNFRIIMGRNRNSFPFTGYQKHYFPIQYLQICQQMQSCFTDCSLTEWDSP